MKQRQSAIYLEECATACPHCRENGRMGKIGRVLSEAKVRRPRDERPSLKVPCYCGECGKTWTESYRLEGAR